MLTSNEQNGILARLYQAKRILVTGGFGFVGGHLVETLLGYRAEVTVLDIDTRPERESLINVGGLRDQVRVVEGDVGDYDTMQALIEGTEFHYIFHLAASATVIEKAAAEPLDTIQSNTLGLVNLLEPIRRSGKMPNMVLFASTDKVYGELGPGEESYEEDRTALRGIGVYDATKLAADVFARSYFEAYRLPITVLRLCNLFGPYDFNTDFRLIPKAMLHIFGGARPRPPELYFEALEHWRDYCYVADGVRAMLLMAYTPAAHGEVYNLPGARHISTPEILKLIVEMSAEVEREHDPARAEEILGNGVAVKTRVNSPQVITIRKQHLDGRKILRDLEFVPDSEFISALRSTIEFHREYYANRRKELPIGHAGA